MPISVINVAGLKLTVSWGSSLLNLEDVVYPSFTQFDLCYVSTTAELQECNPLLYSRSTKALCILLHFEKTSENSHLV